MALAGSFLLGLIAVSLVIFLNVKRSRKKFQYELIPNVLMTRHPLLFVTGKKSLFYFLRYWNRVPEYLANHGYEVYTLDLPWRKSSHRLQVLEHFLTSKEAQKEKFHLIIDPSSATEVAALFAERNFASVASVTLVKNEGTAEDHHRSLRALKHAIEELTIETKTSTPLTWKLHQNFALSSTHPALLGWSAPLATYESFLNRAHFLAERDFSS